MEYPNHPRYRYIQPDERWYGGFMPALLPAMEPIRQQLVEMQRGVAPSTTAVARIALLQKALTDTQEQHNPDFTSALVLTTLRGLHDEVWCGRWARETDGRTRRAIVVIIKERKALALEYVWLISTIPLCG